MRPEFIRRLPTTSEFKLLPPTPTPTPRPKPLPAPTPMPCEWEAAAVNEAVAIFRWLPLMRLLLPPLLLLLLRLRLLWLSEVPVCRALFKPPAELLVKPPDIFVLELTADWRLCRVAALMAAAAALDVVPAVVPTPLECIECAPLLPAMALLSY